ncbi:hypothetical protein [Microbacterium laevaniformans]|uniref:hypothetical protein n=1 Tax=Microbacterium laevaniformans TaxID=36807 RepID=UPI0031E78700
MITFLLRAAVFLASAAVGLIVAVLQSVLAPWLARVAQRNAPAFLGGIGIVSTFVALVGHSAHPRRRTHHRPPVVDLDRRADDRLGRHRESRRSCCRRCC